MQLGIELERERRRVGMTQSRVGAALNCTQSKINKIEHGAVAVSRKDLDGLLRIYNTSNERRDRIELLARQASAGPSAGTPANREYLKLLSLEREANEVQAFHGPRLPNLLQSEHYLLTQYKCAGVSYDTNAILLDRSEREDLFKLERPPRYRVIISAAAFYYMPGGRSSQLAIDQLDHLLRMCARYSEHLFLQVLPFHADLPFVPHDHVVLTFNDPTQDLVYSEYGAGESRIYTGKEQVASHQGYWRTVQAAALSVDDSQIYLHKLIAEAPSW
jgi:transcriptional regulator with XRE-family HTH domain